MFRVSKNGAVNIIHIAGPVNNENCDAFKTFVFESFSRGQPKTVVDLRDVQLMDSCGLESLCDLVKEHSRRGGQLKVATPSALCRDIFQVTGIDSQFEVYDEVLQAVGSFLQ